MKVSVAVPVRNEEEVISATLESLLAQTHRPDEIVIADGGSIDATVEVVRRYSTRGVRVLEIGPAYPGRARNEAIRACVNDWIALVDAGCIADSRWLERLLAARMDSKAGVVFGEYKPWLENEWAIAQALTFVGVQDRHTGLRSPFIASSLMHRKVWEEVGGFREELRAAEDYLFIQKIEATGVAIVRSPDAVVYWRLPSGPATAFRRFRLYSAHHLAAGLFSTWHLRVMMMDCVATALGIGSFFWPPLLVLLVAGGVARLLRTVALRRSNINDEGPFRPRRLLRAGVLLLLADTAMWLGALDYGLAREARK